VLSSRATPDKHEFRTNDNLYSPKSRSALDPEDHCPEETFKCFLDNWHIPSINSFALQHRETSHARQTLDMTTVHHSPPPGATPFAIYEDPDDHAPPSPSEVYEGDASFPPEMSLAGADEVIPSIENGQESTDEPQPYVSSYTSRRSILSTSSQSRRVSGVTTTSFISEIPSEISISSKPVLAAANDVSSRYSPRKDRPPFRNPASVRAMQMSSPPSLPAYDGSRERKGNYKLTTPSRTSRSDTVSTTASRRSRVQRDSVHSDYQALQSPRSTPTPQQSLPLVLLHVTILPMQLLYAHDFMIKAMPGWLVENYRVLGEKLQDIILMRRGILISHPRDEYDVLEERILESLELKTPRLLKCGHFVGADVDTDQDDDEDEDRGSVTDRGTGRGSRMSGGTITAEEEAEWKDPTSESDDASVCVDCHRSVKRPGRGVGIGTKKWEIKIYAANGLMRAGAWSAAWSEMERCDVEISPWIPNDVRKALDKRLQEEQEAALRKRMYAAELERQIAEEAAARKRLEEEAEVKRKTEEVAVQRRVELEAAILQQKLEEEAAAKRRLEESLDQKIEEAKETIRLEFEAQALAEANSIAERIRAMEETLEKEQTKVQAQAPVATPSIQRHTRSPSRERQQSRSRRLTIDEIPISTLLKNYVRLLLQDSRNYLIVILGALVIYLATNVNKEWGLNTSFLDMAAVSPMSQVVDAVPPIVITSTATTTATSVATLTVTKVQQVQNVQETHLPSSSTTSTEAVESKIVTPLQNSSETLESNVPSPSEEVLSQVSASTISRDASEILVSDSTIETAGASATFASLPTVVSEEASPTGSPLIFDLPEEPENVPATAEMENASLDASTSGPISSTAQTPNPDYVLITSALNAKETSGAFVETSNKDEL
jgi:hypothetical protein